MSAIHNLPLLPPEEANAFTKDVQHNQRVPTPSAPPSAGQLPSANFWVDRFGPAPQTLLDRLAQFPLDEQAAIVDQLARLRLPKADQELCLSEFLELTSSAERAHVAQLFGRLQLNDGQKYHFFSGLCFLSSEPREAFIRKQPARLLAPTTSFEQNRYDNELDRLMQDPTTTTTDRKKMQELKDIDKERGGLCEIFCNQVLKDDLLGVGEEADYLFKNITIQQMIEDNIQESHALNLYSPEELNQVMLGIHPDNIFASEDQKNLIQPRINQTDPVQVNPDVLAKGLNRIEIGETIKVAVIKKSSPCLSGHSLLIKKTGVDTFIFFDHNSGEYRNLSLKQLCSKIDTSIKEHKAEDILFIRGRNYLNKMREAIPTLDPARSQEVAG